MLLDRCVWRYNDDLNVSFYSYFYICLKRKIGSLLANLYFDNNVFLEENIPNTIYYNIIGYARELLDEDEQLFFDECIIGFMSISLFSKKYNINYYNATKLRKSILDKIKKHIE